MLAQRNPGQVYRRIDFDARVSAADPQELVRVCYEQLIGALGSALIAHERGDNTMKSQALTRSVSALTALLMGVNGNDPIVDALLRFYGAAKKAILDSVIDFNVETLSRMRRDFIEISESMSRVAI